MTELISRGCDGADFAGVAEVCGHRGVEGAGVAEVCGHRGVEGSGAMEGWSVNEAQPPETATDSGAPQAMFCSAQQVSSISVTSSSAG